jgi:hypothetical protein
MMKRLAAIKNQQSTGELEDLALIIGMMYYIHAFIILIAGYQMARA